MKHLRLVIACLTLLGVLAACTPTQSGRLASYGDPDDESGIGGTGIIGAITGFGSIFVNGVEVEIEPATQLYVDGKRVSAHDFARGEVVEILAADSRGLTHASRVQVRHEVIGTVTRVDSDKARFTVLGQTVLAADRTLPRTGERVRVSGFRDSAGRIHATRIAADSGGSLLLRGEVRDAGNGRFRIGRQEIRTRDGRTPPAGSQVRVQGRLEGGALAASRIERQAATPFGSPVRHLLVQGFVRSAGALYRIDGLSFAPGGSDRPGNSDRLLRLELTRGATGTWAASRVLDERSLPLGRPEPHRGAVGGGHAPAGRYRPAMPPRPGMGGAGRPMR